MGLHLITQVIYNAVRLVYVYFTQLRGNVEKQTNTEIQGKTNAKEPAHWTRVTEACSSESVAFL